MYMNREEVAEPEMTRWVDRVKKPGDAFMAAAKKVFFILIFSIIP